MLIANSRQSDLLAQAHPDVQQNSNVIREVLFWIAGMVLAFVVPLAVVVGAILVSSYGIPLPIEVRVP